MRESERGPLLEGAVSWLECSLHSEHDAGDHTFFVGAVERVELGRDAPGLVYRARALRVGVIDAVVFDLDGLLLDTERLWDEVREELARERGGQWSDRAQADMMGMSSPEWSRYMHDVVGLPESPDEIAEEVVRRMVARYRERLPLIPGALEAVERLAARWPLGLASSSNRPLIDSPSSSAASAPFFAVTVSSEEVGRGKPAPDVYLEAVRQARCRARARRRRRGLGQRDPQRARCGPARRRRSRTRTSRRTRKRSPWPTSWSTRSTS